MRLVFSGAPEVAAPPEHVWSKLLDHELVASCGPGVESVEALDETHFKVVTGLGVGSIKLRFNLDAELQDLEPPHRLRLVVRGKAPGSSVSVDTALTVEAQPPDSSKLNWEAVVEVRGTVASVGARLMQGTARRLTEKFWKDFAAVAGS